VASLERGVAANPRGTLADRMQSPVIGPISRRTWGLAALLSLTFAADYMPSVVRFSGSRAAQLFSQKDVAAHPSPR
jgi:hypothetical protein